MVWFCTMIANPWCKSHSKLQHNDCHVELNNTFRKPHFACLTLACFDFRTSHWKTQAALQNQCNDVIMCVMHHPQHQHAHTLDQECTPVTTTTHSHDAQLAPTPFTVPRQTLDQQHARPSTPSSTKESPRLEASVCKKSFALQEHLA